MTTYVAFLRAINVGGHFTRMAELRSHFEALGLANVQTYLNSGNVSFISDRAAADLEAAIETHLATSLGYAVTTFLRSSAEVTAIASTNLFPDAPPQDDLYVAFLKQPPTAAETQALLALSDAVFQVAVQGREIFWQRSKALGAPGQPGPPLEKALGAPATVRGLRTVQRIAATLGR